MIFVQISVSCQRLDRVLRRVSGPAVRETCPWRAVVDPGATEAWRVTEARGLTIRGL